MTVPRTELFPHLGGRCDGTDMPVEVDEHGVPVEFNLVNDLTDPDPAIPATTGIQSQLIVSTYERDTRATADGVGYVFIYRGSDTIDSNFNWAA